MKLFRTCAAREANIEHFLDELEEIQVIQALQSKLTSHNMIEEVFSRGPSLDDSRFCPVHYSPVPLYASENSMTTFYEYCFHLLNNVQFLSQYRPVNAVLYYLKLTGRPKIKDITTRVPPGVMSKKSYKKAHAFLKKLNPQPDVIKYKSVRDLHQKNNYAIYDKKYVQDNGVDPKKIIMSLKKKKSVLVTIDQFSYEISPNF